MTPIPVTGGTSKQILKKWSEIYYECHNFKQMFMGINAKYIVQWPSGSPINTWENGIICWCTKRKKNRGTHINLIDECMALVNMQQACYQYGQFWLMDHKNISIFSTFYIELQTSRNFYGTHQKQIPPNLSC